MYRNIYQSVVELNTIKYTLIFLLLVFTNHRGQAQLSSGDEVFKIKVDFETGDFKSNFYPDRVYSSVTTYKGTIYFVWVDSQLRPKVAMIKGGNVSTAYLHSDVNYKVYDDSHHKFSIGIDKNGYLHIVGDMHHYPRTKTTWLPLQGKRILYWVSKNPESISSFEFVGDNASRAIPGYGFSYMSFRTDMNGELYARGRSWVYTKRNDGCIGWTMWKYNANNRSWSSLGGMAPSSTNTPQYKSVFWEDNGEAEQPKGAHPSDLFYSRVLW